MKHTHEGRLVILYDIALKGISVIQASTHSTEMTSYIHFYFADVNYWQTSTLWTDKSLMCPRPNLFTGVTFITNHSEDDEAMKDP